MNFEQFNKGFEKRNEANLDTLSLVRDEIRSALIMKACSMDEKKFDECFKTWNEDNNKEFQNLFEEFLAEGGLIDAWDDLDQRGGILNRFEDRINTTNFKKAA